jgi:hypothetical protein
VKVGAERLFSIGANSRRRFFVDWFAEKHPRFVRAFGADADFREFRFGAFGPVAAAKAVVEAHDGGAHFKARLGHRALYVVLQNRMAGHANMPARNEGAQEELAPVTKVVTQVLFLFFGKHSETRQRIAMAAADFGRQPPDAAASGAQFRQFLLGEFQNAVRWVRANRVQRAGGATPQPVKAIRLFDPIQSSPEYQRRLPPVFQLKLKKCGFISICGSALRAENWFDTMSAKL